MPVMFYSVFVCLCVLCLLQISHINKSDRHENFTISLAAYSLSTQMNFSDLLSSGAYSAFQLTGRESGVSLLARKWYDPKDQWRSVPSNPRPTTPNECIYLRLVTSGHVTKMAVTLFDLSYQKTHTTPCPEKRCHFIFCHIFAKSKPIFKILLPSHSAVNLQ